MTAAPSMAEVLAEHAAVWASDVSHYMPVVCGCGAEWPDGDGSDELCSEHGHPGVTYNPWRGRTWCLFGDVARDGDCASHADCCGGQLVEEVIDST